MLNSHDDGLRKSFLSVSNTCVEGAARFVMELLPRRVSKRMQLPPSNRRVACSGRSQWTRFAHAVATANDLLRLLRP